jgi:hypothetical protein
MSPAAYGFATALNHTLRDSRDELRADDFRQLLEAVTETVARLIAESWGNDPDRPARWER